MRRSRAASSPWTPSADPSRSASRAVLASVINHPTTMNTTTFTRLKHVPPINNPAPVIRKGDTPWSEVFERAAKRIPSHIYLCHAVRAAVDGWLKGPGENQADRMERYILDLMQGDYVLSDWAANVNGHSAIRKLDLYAYRAAWARHLSAQFRAKGL